MSDDYPLIKLSVRALVEFVLRCGSIDNRFSGFERANEGIRIHRKLQKSAGKTYQAEVPLRAVRIVDGITYQLDGRADGIIAEETGIVIDEIKTTTVPSEQLTEEFSPVHWAQAKCYGAFLCAEKKLASICVQLTYYQVDTDEIVRHRRTYTAAQLEDFLIDTLHRYTPWALHTQQWRAVRNASIQTLHFPFDTYRPGQYELARAVYKTISARGRLFCSAPTGIGKTISTLFPAVKALGEEKGERIFYLTAKTITRQAAQEAMVRLRAQKAEDDPLRMKTITLTAKDKVCFLAQRECTPDACPYADGYFDRINDALYSFLQENDHFSREQIEAYARKMTLCPFELTLDLTTWCDCIICDYNYLFDPVVNLKRFFAEGGGDYIFLIDEAHNLVDRAREMYSARLCKTAFYSLKKQLGKTPRKLAASLTKLNAYFITLRHQCAQTPKLVISEGLEDFTKLLQNFLQHAMEWLEENRAHALHAEMLQLYFDIRFYLRIAELYDARFTTLVCARGNDILVQLVCLDAAPFLDASMSCGRASILFSATLTPMEYFIKTLGGGEDCKRICLASPFAAQNLCLLAADTISTKYADRAATCEPVCHMIATAVQVQQGNYIVFLPSYKYMREVAEAFSALYPDVPISLQESGMDESARETFLAQFKIKSAQTLLGFCVLGGVFSEGVDLTGDRLIGTIIVGVGLPQIGVEQNLLRDYYAATENMGFEYAYQYPGMNKVLQAAGRVIRTDADKGMVLLIDNRYATPGYRQLFPPHWAHCQRVANPQQLQLSLQKFWQQT